MELKVNTTPYGAISIKAGCQSGVITRDDAKALADMLLIEVAKPVGIIWKILNSAGIEKRRGTIAKVELHNDGLFKSLAEAGLAISLSDNPGVFNYVFAHDGWYMVPV